MIFDKAFNVITAVANNQQLIAAPGAGLSIYLQTISMANINLAAGATTEAQVHAAGGVAFADLGANGNVNVIDWRTFPGGFKLPGNTALQVDVSTNINRMTGSYTIGPA